MGRAAHPWYRKSHRMWFATVAGEKRPLGVRDPNDQDGAEAAYQRLLADLASKLGGYKTPPDIETGRGLVAEKVAEFLTRAATRISPGCLRQYKFALAVHFVTWFGGRRLDSLTADEIEDWANRPDWSNSYRNNLLGTVSTFLKWAKHPLQLKRPPKESRGASAVLSDEQFAVVLRESRISNASTDFPELLTVLRETGARPGEVAGLTVESVDWPNCCARLKQHKTAHHGSNRVLHFSNASMVILTRQRFKHTSGPLFRSQHGRPYRPHTITARMMQISERCGFGVTAYGLRHTFATRALSAGVPDAIVAELLGHKGTGMLTRHYAHLGEQSRALKAAIEHVSRKAG